MSVDDSQYAKGFIPRDYATHPHGSLECASAFDLQTIPRTKWPGMIADMEKSKSRLSDIAAQNSIPILNQGSVGYCHAFSACMGVMLMRAAQGLSYIELSASSIGGPITGFRNAGAYIFDDLKQAKDFGVASTKTYPMLTTENHWDTAAKQDAALHKVTEWMDGENRNFDQVMTCLLSRLPVCVGLNWWSHAVTYLDPIYENGKFGIVGRNSWGTGWSYGGAPAGHFKFMEGYGQNRATPDEWYVPRQITGA